MSVPIRKGKSVLPATCADEPRKTMRRSKELWQTLRNPQEPQGTQKCEKIFKFYTCGWEDWLTLANWNGRKGGDFLMSRVRSIGNWQKKIFSPSPLWNMAMSNIRLLAYFSCMGYCFFLQDFLIKNNILWLYQSCFGYENVILPWKPNFYSACRPKTAKSGQ